jgi:hypothetical protein
VAKTQTASPQLGLTRAKAILIGVLGVVLVAVVFMQYRRFSGGGTLEAAGPATAPPSKPRVEKATTSAVKPAVATEAATHDAQTALLELDQAKWKSPDVATVIAYDPFALPAAFPQPPRIVGEGRIDGSGLTAAEQTQQLADALEAVRTQLDELKQRGVQVILGKNGEYVAMVGDRLIHVGDEINQFTVTDINPRDGVLVEWKDSQ